jgi:TRAP-type mannitol/chloroaromatic compound transport system substrate-binding protein
VYKELDADNPSWAKIYPDYAAFLSDSVKWFALAEASYGGYMTAKAGEL